MSAFGHLISPRHLSPGPYQEAITDIFAISTGSAVGQLCNVRTLHRNVEGVAAYNLVHVR